MGDLFVMSERETPSDDFFLDHIHSPYHRGQLNNKTVNQAGRNPFCGDRIEVQLLFDTENEVDEAWHNGNGCITSLAAASILCEHIEGKSAVELAKFTRDDMLALLGIQLTPLRKHCALVAFNALREILVSLGGDETVPE